MKRIWRGIGVALVVVLAACGDDEAAEPTRAELIDALVDGGVAPVDARCWVGEVYEHLSLEDKRAIESVDAGYDEYADKERVRAANARCL